METLDEQSWLVSSAGYELWTLKVQCSLFWAIECDWNVFFALDIEAKIRGSKSWCREQLKIHRDQFVVESLSTITIFFNLNLTSPIILRRMSKKEKGSLWDHHQQVKCKGRHLSEIEKKVYGGYWYHARWEIAGKKCQADPSSWSLGAWYSGLKWNSYIDYAITPHHLSWSPPLKITFSLAAASA